MVDNQLVTYLSGFLTDERKSLFNSVLLNRTRYLTIVLEDIYHSQNASAVLRTCDCFGIQDVHIIENNHQYDINPDVAIGSYKWLTMMRYNQKPGNTAHALKLLKKKGYRIVATSPHRQGVKLDDFDLDKGKSALVFGTEHSGISDIVMDHADEFVSIPMYGFTESFNISVSAAICMNSLVTRLKQSTLPWQLSQSESDEILLEWLKKSVKHSDLLVKRYHAENQNLL